MAEAAATSYNLLGIECGVVPFDLCVEAEAMGCEINVYAHSEDLLYPTIKKKLIQTRRRWRSPSRGRRPRPDAADGRGDRPAEKAAGDGRRWFYVLEALHAGVKLLNDSWLSFQPDKIGVDPSQRRGIQVAKVYE
jgi:hypothetical protein